jgi:hypothetical protein
VPPLIGAASGIKVKPRSSAFFTHNRHRPLADHDTPTAVFPKAITRACPWVRTCSKILARSRPAIAPLRSTLKTNHLGCESGAGHRGGRSLVSRARRVMACNRNLTYVLSGSAST